MKMTRIRVAGLAALATAATAVGIAAADTATSAPDRNATVVASVEAAITDNFAVFRDEQAIPKSSQPASLKARQGLFGMNTDLARGTRLTATGASTYAVPGNGTICLYGDEVGGACAPVSAAIDTPALTVGICGPAIPRGQLIVAGLVADKITDLQVTLRDGSIAKGDVQKNVYTAYAPLSPTTLPVQATWTDTNGARQTQPIAVPTTVTAAPCEK